MMPARAASISLQSKGQGWAGHAQCEAHETKSGMPAMCPLNLAHIPDAVPGNSGSAAPCRTPAFLCAWVRV